MIDERIESIDFEEINYKIAEVTEYITEDDYDGADEIIDELLEETEDIYKEDEKERFFCFDSPIQFYLYDMKLGADKMIKRSEIDYRTFYLSKAHISLAYERYEETEEYQKKHYTGILLILLYFFFLQNYMLKQTKPQNLILC